MCFFFRSLIGWYLNSYICAACFKISFECWDFFFSGISSHVDWQFVRWQLLFDSFGHCGPGLSWCLFFYSHGLFPAGQKQMVFWCILSWGGQQAWELNLQTYMNHHESIIYVVLLFVSSLRAEFHIVRRHGTPVLFATTSIIVWTGFSFQRWCLGFQCNAG